MPPFVNNLDYTRHNISTGNDVAVNAPRTTMQTLQTFLFRQRSPRLK